MSYAGIVVDEDNVVPKHVRDAKEIALYDLGEDILEKEKISLEGIKEDLFPGLYLHNSIKGKGVKYLYTGRKLRLWKLWPFLMRVSGTRNRAAPGRELSDIVNELKGKYAPEEAPAYEVPSKLAGKGAY